MKAETLEETVLKNVAPGSIIRVEGRWGVLCSAGRVKFCRTVDFWDGGREQVPVDAPVEVLVKR